jgi:hypothetical protein
MLKFKSIFLLIVISISFSNCSFNKEKLYLSNLNRHYNNGKDIFVKNYQKSNLLDFFPEQIIDTSSRYSSFPPTCPPRFECMSQFGETFLCTSLDSFSGINMQDSLLYATTYFCDSNLIINQFEFAKVKTVIDKCNIYFNGRYPIPCFENYNLGLGKTTEEQVINQETHYLNIYTVPSDLKVYVVEAEAGDFWEIPCNEERPESLKHWKHGYSKGHAISEDLNLIIYWAMIW